MLKNFNFRQIWILENSYVSEPRSKVEKIYSYPSASITDCDNHNTYSFTCCDNNCINFDNICHYLSYFIYIITSFIFDKKFIAIEVTWVNALHQLCVVLSRSSSYLANLDQIYTWSNCSGRRQEIFTFHDPFPIVRGLVMGKGLWTLSP